MITGIEVKVGGGVDFCMDYNHYYWNAYMSVATSNNCSVRLRVFVELSRKGPISCDFIFAVLCNCMHFVQQMHVNLILYKDKCIVHR